MNAQAICFDLDGTLLDTLDDLADSMNAVLAARDLPVHPVAPYRHFVGSGIVTLVRRALPEARRGDDALVQICVDEMRAAYAERWDNKTQPYPGIPELLDGLVELGLTLTVLSNKPDDFTRLAVDKLLARWSFAEVRGVREGVPPKPDPAGLEALLASFAWPKERWLYIGDSNIDVRTAKAGGLTSVGVLWGFRDREELAAEGATHLVAEPSEILALARGGA